MKSFKQHIKKKFLLLLLLIAGLHSPISAQEIIINENDSSWTQEEIPSKALSKKKFTVLRRWYQNTVTHYNFYFNCKQTLKRSISLAKEQHKDNYDSIISITPFQSADIRMFSADMDSIIYNASIGIQTHDPRSKWVKRLYLLTGKAYFYKGDYGKAIDLFKYMIKNLGERDKMNRPKIVGTRAYQSEENISIMTSEAKNNHTTFARNDAFIWLIRSYFKQKNFDRMTTLMSSIKSDPNLPQRLLGQLQLIQFKYYTQTHRQTDALQVLQKAIASAQNKELQARQQFVLSQLYEQQGNLRSALANYQKVEDYKPSPEMEFFTQLRIILIQASRPSHSYSLTKANLLKIANKRKFAHFRGILYQYLGKLALQTGHAKEGIAFLEKGLSFKDQNKETLSKTHLLLAHYYYKNANFRLAKKHFNLALAAAPNANINHEKIAALSEIVSNLEVIQQEDSLQQLANLPKDSLYAFLQSIVKDSVKTRKKQNLILEGTPTNKNNVFRNKTSPLPNRNQGSNTKWYFYNNDVKARGYSTFKSHWGKRPLKDNWRLSDPDAYSNTNNTRISSQDAILKPQTQQNNGQHFAEQLFNQLYSPIPTDSSSRSASEKKEMDAYHKIINIYYLQLKNNKAALSAIQKLLTHKKNNPYLAACYYKLYLIYKASNQENKAIHYKQLLENQFPDNKLAETFSTPTTKKAEEDKQNKVEQLYNKAYQSYKSGHWEQISILRKKAGKLQQEEQQQARFDLLNAMTLIKADSIDSGMTALKQVIDKYPNQKAIVQRAKLISSKVENKDQIIQHIKTIYIPPEDTSQINNQYTTNLSKQHKPQDNKKPQRRNTANKEDKQAAQKSEPEIEQPEQNKQPTETQKTEKAISTPYKIERNVPYYVILRFNKTYTKLINKSKKVFDNYNQKYYPNDSIKVSRYVLEHNQAILIFRPFKNEREALLYYHKLKKDVQLETIPNISASDYKYFFISKNNFIILYKAHDLNGYLTFFHEHYK